MGSTQGASTAVSIAGGTLKSRVDSSIITKTLDTLNKTAPSKGKGKYSSAANGMATSYDFNKSVLSAVYGATGAIANLTS